MNYKLIKRGKYCLIGLLVLLSLSTFGQSVPPKVKKLYDKGEYEKCIEVTKSIKDRGDNSKNPYLYLYQTMCYYKIALEPESYNVRNPVDRAVRAFSTFRRRDKNGSVAADNKEFINEFMLFTMNHVKELVQSYETIQDGFELLYKIIPLFQGDDELTYQHAELMMEYGTVGTKVKGFTSMRMLAVKYHTMFKEGKRPPENMDKVFAKLAIYLYETDNKEDARIYLNWGKEIYPTSLVIRNASYVLLDMSIDINPETSSLGEILKAKTEVEIEIKASPNDAEIKKKEDAIVVILADKYLLQGSTEGMVNTMMAHINKYPERREELSNYYQAYLYNIIISNTAEHKKITAIDASSQIKLRLKGTSKYSDDDKMEQSIELLQEQFDKNNLEGLTYLHNLMDKWQPNSNKLSAFMTRLNYSGIATAIMNKPLSLINFSKLIAVSNSTVNNKYYKYSEADYALSYIEILLKEKGYSACAYILKFEMKRYPDDIRFLALKKKMAIQDYIDNYLGSELGWEDFKWNGDINRCNEGTLPQKYHDVVLQRMAYVRRAVGVRDDVYFDKERNKYCQKAALMMQANGKLSHSPSKLWKCYTEDGARGAGSSNLSLGYSLEDALMGQMEDGGSGNYACGHRRWILNPGNIEFGHGSTQSAMALAVFGGKLQRDGSIYDSIPPIWTNEDFVAWPPVDYAVKNIVPRRWSFSYAGADFEDAKIKVKIDGRPKGIKVEPLKQGYGLNTIVWFVEGFSYEAGQVVEVTVSNFKVYGKSGPVSVSYKTEILPVPEVN